MTVGESDRTAEPTITCPGCRKEASEPVGSCPHCGLSLAAESDSTNDDEAAEVAAASVIQTSPQLPARDTVPVKTREFPWWYWVVIVGTAMVGIAALGSVIGGLTGGSDGTRQDPTSGAGAAVDTGPKAGPFVAQVVSYEAQNPTSLQIVIEITNQGDLPGEWQCVVKARDPSGEYHGTDMISAHSPLAAGATASHAGGITITSDGAGAVTEIEVPVCGFG